MEERIAAAGVDEATAAAARERLAALDPDGWETTEDAVRGIETFEAETDAILALLGWTGLTGMDGTPARAVPEVGRR